MNPIRFYCDDEECLFCEFEEDCYKESQNIGEMNVSFQ